MDFTWILFCVLTYFAIVTLQVITGFEPKDRCMLLKFVTSCSRAPLLGFKHLQPTFTIHKVSYLSDFFRWDFHVPSSFVCPEFYLFIFILCSGKHTHTPTQHTPTQVPSISTASCLSWVIMWYLCSSKNLQIIKVFWHSCICFRYFD